MYGGNGHRSYYPFELLYINVDQSEEFKKQKEEKQQEKNINNNFKNISL
jgi:hypothetical protein